MKYILLLFFIATTNLFSQATGEVVYGVKFNLTIDKINENTKKTNKKYLNRDLIRSLKKMVRNSVEVEGVLEFSNGYANYNLLDEMENEGDYGFGSYALKGSGGGKKSYYTSLLLQKNEVKDCEMLDECYLIENEKPTWQLTQETKIIGGYLCYKAIRTNSEFINFNPVAWYTNEIPLGYGPLDYYGLPGLILELELTIVTFKAKKITLNPKNNIKVREPKGKKITKKEYDKLLRKTFPSFYNYKK
ncbi:conserved exported protein of unknown function [Tenacibaculum soleae]|uniref:GLPGLI family protein n=1 Tax=Tenacibaculum soleae TaxID=447689 RepID=UPI003AB2C542